MGFTYTVTKKGAMGDMRYAIVEYVNSGAGDIGGVISYRYTAMKKVLFADPTTETSAAATMIKTEKNTGASAAENGSMKITTVANEDGTILILGI
jgi:hypothetical protein